MSAKFRIVIPTKQKLNTFINSTQFKCIDEIANKDRCIIDVRPENKTGLSELYQNVLDDEEEDYIVFMHDDLEIHDHFLLDKLEKAHEQYDIVGLAGATSQNYKRTDVPMVWHLCRNKPEHARGFVSHYIPKGFNGVAETHINSAYFGPTPGKVVVIDGLFMSFKMKEVWAEGIELFDKDFTFHHYDMAMCARAITNKFTIGVWPIFAIHYGLGEFANDPVWQDHAIKFKQKYGQLSYSV